MLDQVLSTAEDFVVVGSAGKDKVRFAFPSKGDIARHYFDQSPGVRSRHVDGFSGYWRYNPETGLIEGSDTFLTLGFDEVVRQDGF
ncbi:MAG: hypothetical protein ACP5D2_00015 [Candidatus Nanoarchaeia archaeon]